jgi:hypothetical protein
MSETREFRKFKKVRSIGSPKEIDQCIVMPIHNSENHILAVLEALITCTSRPSILVIVFDACTDSSIEKVFGYFDSREKWISDSSFLCVDFFVSKKDLYESRIDNFALFSYPQTQYLISVQSDILIQEPGYDVLFVGALGSNSDLFMISGRGTHIFPNGRHLESIKEIVRKFFNKVPESAKLEIEARLRLVDNPERVLELSEDLFFAQDYFGRCGEFHEHRIQADGRYLYLSEAVIRGPLIYFAPTLRQLGGLDWRKHRLGSDDHSAALRGWRVLGMRTAYLPVTYSSPLHWGSTRSKKTRVQKARYTLMRVSERIHHIFSCEIMLKRNEVVRPVKEIRQLKSLSK